MATANATRDSSAQRYTQLTSVGDTIARQPELGPALGRVQPVGGTMQ